MTTGVGMGVTTVAARRTLIAVGSIAIAADARRQLDAKFIPLHQPAERLHVVDRAAAGAVIASGCSVGCAAVAFAGASGTLHEAA